MLHRMLSFVWMTVLVCFHFSFVFKNHLCYFYILLLFCVNLWSDDLMWSHIYFEFSAFYFLRNLSICSYELYLVFQKIKLLRIVEDVCGFPPSFPSVPCCQTTTRLGEISPCQPRKSVCTSIFPGGAAYPGFCHPCYQMSPQRCGVGCFHPGWIHRMARGGPLTTLGFESGPYTIAKKMEKPRRCRP